MHALLSVVKAWGDRGVTISRFLYPVLPPPIPFCPFVSWVPPFIVFLPLSCKSCCLTPYSNRESLSVPNKKLCLHHVAKSSVFCELQSYRASSQEGLPWRDFSPPHRKIQRPIKMVFNNIWPDSLCHSYREFRQLARQRDSPCTCTCVMTSHSCLMI